MRCGARRRRLCPSNVMVPSVATWPAMVFSSVLLPAPLAPTTATTSPASTAAMSTPCSAFRPR